MTDGPTFHGEVSASGEVVATVTCPTCDGDGTSQGQTCPTCDGTGCVLPDENES